MWSGAYYNGSALDDTTFDVVVVPVPGVSLEQAEAAMDQALADFIATGVDAAQLERIKMQLRAAQIYERDNVNGIGNRYGRALAIGLSVQDVQDWPDLLQAVTAEQIMAAAKQVFRPEASVTGWLMRDGEVSQ